MKSELPVPDGGAIEADIPVSRSSTLRTAQRASKSPRASTDARHLTLKCNLCGRPEARLLIRKDAFDVVRCEGCSLVYVANPPNPEELRRLYSSDSGYHLDRIVDATVRASERQAAQKKLALLDKVAPNRGRLLDVGCSTGQFLATAKAAGWECRGVEYSADSARNARERLGLDVFAGTLDERPYPDERFDAITMWDVLEHVPDPSRQLAIVRDMLKPNGVLIIETPRVDGAYPVASLRLAKVLGFWGHPEPPGHLYQFSLSTCSRLLEKSGFEVVRSIDRRISITYSFGTPRDWLRSAKWFAYCIVFIPLAWIGPWIKRGDTMTLIARPKATI